MPLPGLNANNYDPKYVSRKDTLYGQSRRVVMFRDVWEYEFSMLGELRQAKLLVPDDENGVQAKNVWYMVYRIRDLGKTLTYEQVKQDPNFDHIKNELKYNEPLKSEEKFFLPRFTLEGLVYSKAIEQYQKVVYRDKVSPMVLRQIQRREDPAIQLLDPVTMSKVQIPVAKSDADGGVWGVAVFEDVDPRIDYVSVYVSGLTNAFRLGDSPSDPTKKKTLQLNFWRGGDTIDQEKDSILYGIPLVDDPQEQALIAARYALPGPVIRAYKINQEAGSRKVLVVEADAKVNLTDFSSAVAPILEQGTLEPSIARAFAAAGIAIDPQVALTTMVPGKRWTFKQGEDEYILALEPQFWEPVVEGGIRFIKSLDSLWIYR